MHKLNTTLPLRTVKLILPKTTTSSVDENERKTLDEVSKKTSSLTILVTINAGLDFSENDVEF